MSKTLQGTEGRVFEEFISEEAIREIVADVARRITNDYKDKEPLFVCVLNGGYIYAADLYRAIPLPSKITFVRLKSYEGMETTGHVEMVVPLSEDIAGRDIIVIEDIVDTGTTMHHFKQMLLNKGARSVSLTAFLFKPDALRYEDATPDYIGRSIPNKFVLGYGLDYNGLGRNIPAVYVLKD